MKPRIALDARLTRQMSVGMRAYARELAERLPRVAPDLEFLAFRDGGNFGWHEQVALPIALWRARVDLTHFLSIYAPLPAPRAYVVTVHDLIHLRFPQYFKRKVGPYYRTVVRTVCARAARVITDDERTVDDLRRFLGVDPSRIRVVPLGVDDRYLGPVKPYRGERPYLLYAGNHRAHKDLPTLLHAWSQLAQAQELDLFLTGHDDFGGELAKYTPQRGRVVLLGDVSIDELAAYYAGAAALVHPALVEGFGLPMLEAMAAGCPVIASESALPGALHGAALTFAPRDPAHAAAAAQRLFGDEGLRARLVNEGRARAAALTWDRCAERTAAIYREVLEERSS